MSLNDQGLGVTIVWVPAHCDVFGNEWADNMAKMASKRMRVDIPVCLGKSEYKQQLKRSMKDDWQSAWHKYKGNGMLKKVKPEVNFRMNSWPVKRSHEVVFRRLRMGTCRSLKKFLHDIGRHEDGKCDTCGVLDTVQHFLLECRKFRVQRREFKDKLWEDRASTFDIESILGGPDPPIRDIMEYIKQSGVSL